jgi:virginiamycin B lyase
MSRIWLAGIGLISSTILLAQTVSVAEFPVPTANADTGSIVTGPDGALWFTEALGNKIGRITTEGALTEYPVSVPAGVAASGVSGLSGIAVGSDGALWFTDGNANFIGRITPPPAGQTNPVSITEYPVPTANSVPMGIAAGPDGALWFTEAGGNKIGRITTAGAISEFPISLSKAAPQQILPGPDGALWFTQIPAWMGRITPSGNLTEYPIGGGCGGASGPLALGPDGALWFTTLQGVCSVTTSAAFTKYEAPAFPPDFPRGITTGPDGALWITEEAGPNSASSQIVRLTTANTFSVYAVATLGMTGITTGPDGALWFAAGDAIGRAVIVEANAFFNGEQTVNPVLSYLQFQNGNPFGYHAFLQGSPSTMNAYVYHTDLGLEYVQAGSTPGSLYLYDVASGHWWFSSSSLFPYLYDFTLNSWIYYFPNQQTPGHYTANPRSFANLSTTQIFTL